MVKILNRCLYMTLKYDLIYQYTKNKIIMIIDVDIYSNVNI